MSWSFSAIGSPEKIAAALDGQSGKLNGQSKLEFDDALPFIKGLLAQNFGGSPGYLLRIDANGSGSAQVDPVSKEAKQVQRSCMVKIEPIYANLLI